MSQRKSAHVYCICNILGSRSSALVWKRIDRGKLLEVKNGKKGIRRKDKRKGDLPEEFHS